MKFFKQDTIITLQQKRKEAIILIVCFILANLLNLSGILIYKTSFTELYTQWAIVIVISMILYTLTIIFRSLLLLINKHKNRHNKG